MKCRGWIAAWIVAGCGPQVIVPEDEATGSTASSEEGPDATFTTAVTTTTIGETGVPPDPSTTNGDEAGDDSSTGAPPGEGCAALLDCDESCQQWEVFLQGDAGYQDWIDRIAIGSGGTILAAGQRDAVDSDPGVAFLQVYRDDGVLVDEYAPFADLAIGAMRVTGVAVAPDGRIGVIGWRDPGENRSAMIELREPDGTFIVGEGQVLLGGTIDALAVTFAADGDLVVGGTRVEPGVSAGGLLWRYEPDFELAWMLMGDEIDVDFMRVSALAAFDDGDVLVGGGVGSFATTTWLGRVGPDGSVRWSGVDTITGGSGHAIVDVAITSEEDVLAVGWQADPSSWGLPWVARFAGEGELVWTRPQQVPDGAPNLLDGVVVDDEGRIFVSGLHLLEDGGRARHVQQLDCDGYVVWEWVHENPAAGGWNAGGGLAWSSELGLVVSGSDFVTDVDQRGFVARLVP